MRCGRAIWAAMVVVALAVAIVGARAADATKYPDWEGQWERTEGAQFDPSKPPGLKQQPPLTAEYQAIWEANLRESDAGGQNYNPQARCIPGGMPRMMIAYQPLEFIVTPATTYVAVSGRNEFRRIYTDGRDWPNNVMPSYSGYSIGRWLDADGDGRYGALEVETKDLKGPRLVDATGIPLHEDNQTVVKERIFLDKADLDVLHDEITISDHAFTQPWTVTRSYHRKRNPTWVEDACEEGNRWVFIGGETYLKGPDDLLMPTRKDEPLPDLKYFKSPEK
jgi:hypothetical protein